MVDRDHYFRKTRTMIFNEVVMVSAGELLDPVEQCCLIQIGSNGSDGPFTTAYLNDKQVRKLTKDLTDYLKGEKGRDQC